MNVVPSLAVLISLAAVWFLFQVQGSCVRCGGRGAHRHDCPLKK
jgi:hypothetical protein